jgi:glycosyltransferase involved in cell wall biosynthesis
MAGRLRALFLNEGALGPGVMGHERAAQTLEGQLEAADVDARFCRLPAMSSSARLAVAGVPLLERLDLDGHTVRWHLVQAGRARRLLRAELARAPADLLHLHSHTLSFLVTREMRRVPTLLSIDATVWDWHAMEIWRDVRPYSRALLAPSIMLECRSLEAAARVLAFTPWTKARVEAHCPGANVVVHHPGIDLEVFSPGPSTNGARPRVLFVGGRFAEKGGDDLLAALGPLAGRTLDLDLVTQDRVEARAGVNVHRIAADDRRALIELYRHADVFCLPTHGDAAPWAVLEAMACSVPVIATPIGGIPDLLDGGAAGLLVERGDPAGVREAVQTLLADQTRRLELGRIGRAQCEQRYDARAQAARLVEIMREAADVRPNA